MRKCDGDGVVTTCERFFFYGTDRERMRNVREEGFERVMFSLSSFVSFSL
jgi:hypothetical protein